jgi:hydrogenase maturation protease
MSARVLVAGIGNIFFGDDAFGPAVLARLAGESLPGVRFEDFGIRGMHLAYELLSGYEAAVIVDAVARDGAPGTLYVIDPSEPILATAPDAHRMDLGSVFGYVQLLGGEPPPITIVGCQPESLEEGAELSATVARAVEAALPLVLRVARERIHNEEHACTEV